MLTKSTHPTNCHGCYGPGDTMMVKVTLPDGGGQFLRRYCVACRFALLTMAERFNLTIETKEYH
jgi:hypothetical protein